MSHHPIADQALLSDLHSAVLVDLTGSIDWWCLPHFSSPSVFARILDEDAGHFRVGPTEVADVERHYLEDSLVLRTTFRTPNGVLELSDALAMAEGARNHDLGADSPHLVVRQARCTQGEVELEVDFAPRFEYGLTTPIVTHADDGVIATGGPTTLRLATSVRLVADGARAVGRTRLNKGQTAEFALHGVHTWHPSASEASTESVAHRLDDTVEAWKSWARSHQHYEGAYADLVSLSGRVLHGLTFQQTGALVAAPTTSLPETIGGERNWDYRYAWVRDASLTLNALWIAACPDEATDFLSYLTAAASSIYGKRHIQIMFGVRGERDLSERELPWLKGWRDSRPVRVGNGAWTQAQIDVYGELLDAVHRIRGNLGEVPEQQRRFLITLADRAASGWRDTDQGIWEIRGEPRHFLHSKLMSWVALDRAMDLAPHIGADDRVPGWLAIREEIRAAIETEGWNDRMGAFTQSFGSTDLDASALLIPLVGFLAPDDPRVLSTIDAIAAGLSDERGLLLRYRSEDGLGGSEGSFLICTFWLAEAQARAGRVQEARAVFERAVSYANDLGLLSEEVDTATGELIGNFPQAFSHTGLVNAAWAISQADHVGPVGPEVAAG